MRVRRFRPGDAPALAQIFFSAVHEIAIRYYSTEQVEAWAPTIPASEQIAATASDGRLVLVAVDEHDCALAYGDLEPDGHIDHLYCRPAWASTGVAGAVYDAIEAQATAAGMGRLYLEASEPARRFFLKRGFVVVARHDFELDGVPIHNFRMEKRLG